MSDLEFRRMEPTEDDLGRFADCFARNEDTKDPRLLKWQFLANPVTHADPTQLFTDFAVEPDTGHLGAIYATSPVELKIGPHRTVAVQSLDTLTDKNHRRKGLFNKMSAAVYARCKEAGVSLVYGFPNGASAPGFFSKSGWSRLDPVPFLVLPLRARYFLRKAGLSSGIARFAPDWLPTRQPPPLLAANEEVAVQLVLEPAVDALWESFSQPIRIGVIRDRKYLSWRLKRPGGGYKVFAFRRAGELRGLAVTTLKEKHGGSIGYVMEVLHAPDDSRAGEVVLNAAIDDLAAQKCDAVLAWCLEHSPNRTTYRRVGFRTLPDWARPIELHFGALALDAPADAAVGNRRNWYLSYLDSDTV